MREQIADAFQRHFHQFGFKKTAVDDVARELKISKKTIYQFFSSKEEILQYVIQRNAQDYLVELAGQIRQAADAFEQLEQLIRLIHKVARDFHASNLSFALQFRLELAEAAYRQAYMKMVADLVETGVQKGVFHTGDLAITTHYINLVVGESLHLMLAQPEDPAVEDPAVEDPVADETIHVVRKILG